MKQAKDQKAVAGYNAATGTSNPGFDKFSTKYCGNMNQHGNPDALLNKGRGPTVGNLGKLNAGPMHPDVAKTPNYAPGRDMFKGSANPQVRTPGGTREFMPSATKNYKGNEDKMNCGRGPTKGNQQ